LKKNKAILKITAALLVLLLMLSITPKLFLHEVLADHKDAPSCNDTNLEGPCIHKQGFNCQQSDLVVPTVYLINASTALVQSADFRVIQKFSYSSHLTKNIVSLSHERGPPMYV